MYSISNDYFCCLKIEISPLLEGSDSLEQSTNYFLFKNKMHLKEDKLFKKRHVKPDFIIFNGSASKRKGNFGKRTFQRWLGT